ncbi:MAG: site-2 protease family protein [Candidatus Moraniibacteriota bacterium]
MLESFFSLQTLSFLIAIVVALTIHEFAHAFVANYLGDPTAKYAGRLSLNPIRHLDPMGTALLLIFLFTVGLGFGWGKPVPINPYNLRHRHGELLVSLAGPFSNLLLAILLILVVAMLPTGVTGGWSNDFSGLINILVAVNVMLGIFNLLPIPPLDGSKILFDLLPQGQTEVRASFERYGPFILIAVILFGFGFLGSFVKLVIVALEYLGQVIHALIY